MDSRDIFATTVAHYLAPIRPYFDDPTVTEVMINSANEIYIERDGQLIRTDACFADQEAFEASINNILQFTGKSLSDDQLLIDSRLPDGSRVHVAKAPCARFGTTMTIRKFSQQMLDIDWLMELGTLTEQANEYLKLAVQAERNLLIAGGTSSGKTSLLNALSRYIPDRQRIVVIEDSAELQLQQANVICLECRRADRDGHGAVTIRDLFRSSLRLRPDRIIIGEVRGGEALDMIQAMTCGHGGSMVTLHANSPADALNRLETMAMMSEINLPLHALRAQISSAIDVVVQMNRHIDGQRFVTQISEIDPLSDVGQYRHRDLFVMKTDPDHNDQEVTRLVWTGQQSAMTTTLGTQDQASISPLTERIFGIE